MKYKVVIIGISITVAATQDTVEYDSNDNQYDKGATLPDFWNGKTTTPVAKSEDGKYHITSAAELVWLMDNTQDANSAYIGKTLVLDRDINLGGYTVKGIGSEQCNFAGNFDGQEFTISNFVIERSGKGYYAGLFNYVMGSTISNLTVENANVSGDAVGYMLNATVENVSVKDTDIYVESTDDTQYGKVVGYENTGAVVTNVSDENVAIMFIARVNTLEDFTTAVNNAQISKIVLTGDITNETVPLNAGQNAYTYILKARNLTIDLNGHIFNTPVRMFSVEEYKGIASTLNIMSGKQGGKINMNKTGGSEAYGFVVKQNCILNIKGNVTIEMNLPSRASYNSLILNNGTVNMDGGKLIGYNTVIIASHYTAKNNGIFNMYGGEINIDASSTGIQTAGSDNAIINLTKGSITGNGVAYQRLYGGVYNVSRDFIIADTCTISVK